MRFKRLILFLFTIGLGLGLGVIYGWVIAPMQHADASLDLLRDDYKADYVLMTAEIYLSDQNLDQAAQRLTRLGDEPAAQIAAKALQTAQTLAYPAADQEKISQFVQALQTTPQSAPQPAPTTLPTEAAP